MEPSIRGMIKRPSGEPAKGTHALCDAIDMLTPLALLTLPSMRKAGGAEIRPPVARPLRSVKLPFSRAEPP